MFGKKIPISLRHQADGSGLHVYVVHSKSVRTTFAECVVHLVCRLMQALHLNPKTLRFTEKRTEAIDKDAGCMPGLGVRVEGLRS